MERPHPAHYLLNDFSKFIEASGHKHSCLLQGLVLGYCGFRSLVGTSSSMAKLDLGSREQQRYWACYASRKGQRLPGNISTDVRVACAQYFTRAPSYMHSVCWGQDTRLLVQLQDHPLHMSHVWYPWGSGQRNGKEA